MTTPQRINFKRLPFAEWRARQGPVVKTNTATDLGKLVETARAKWLVKEKKHLRTGVATVNERVKMGNIMVHACMDTGDEPLGKDNQRVAGAVVKSVRRDGYNAEGYGVTRDLTQAENLAEFSQSIGHYTTVLFTPPCKNDSILAVTLNAI